MAEPEDYCETLGVARGADEKAINDAFRKLALKNHPDRNEAPDATDRFREIAEMTPLKIRRVQLCQPFSEDVDWLRRTFDRESAPFGTCVALAPGGRLAVF